MESDSKNAKAPQNRPLGQHRRDYEEFAQEIAWLEGVDEDQPAEHPSAIGRRRWSVFIAVLIMTAVLVAAVWYLTGLPSCANPPNAWTPCFATE